MLTAADIMVTRDERYSLQDGYNLQITDLEPQDAGDYVCQISDKVNKDQIHTVEILGGYFQSNLARPDQTPQLIRPSLFSRQFPQA